MYLFTLLIISKIKFICICQEWAVYCSEYAGRKTVTVLLIFTLMKILEKSHKNCNFQSKENDMVSVWSFGPWLPKNEYSSPAQESKAKANSILVTEFSNTIPPRNLYFLYI